MPGKRCGSSHVATHGDSPDGELIPRQQVPGKTQQQREHEKNHADVPVELAWRLVRTRHENAIHVEPDSNDHGVRAPAMDFTHDSKRDLLPQISNIHVRVFERRPIVEHQQQSREREHEE